MQGTQTTVRVNLETEQGRRHQRRIEESRQQLRDGRRRGSLFPAPTKATKPTTKS
jgi:hypothetical protein